jgi:hypothetical protein
MQINPVFAYILAAFGLIATKGNALIYPFTVSHIIEGAFPNSSA